MWLVAAASFPDSSVGKESACNARDPISIPGLGRSPGEGKGYPLQYSGLENSMDCIVHWVAESGTTKWLSLSSASSPTLWSVGKPQLCLLGLWGQQEASPSPLAGWTGILKDVCVWGGGGCFLFFFSHQFQTHSVSIIEQVYVIHYVINTGV